MATPQNVTTDPKDKYPVLLLSAISISTLFVVLGIKFDHWLFLSISTNVGIGYGIWKAHLKNRNARQAQQAKIGLLLDAVPTGIVLTKGGKEAQRIVNNRFHEITCTEERNEAEIDSILSNLLNDPITSIHKEPTEKQIVRKDGSIVWVQVTTDRTEPTNDNSDFQIHTVTDISRIKEIEENFAKKDAQMQFIFNSAPIGLHWSCDREERNRGPIKDRIFNIAHQDITGLSKEEMNIPGIFSSITHPYDSIIQENARKRLTNKESNRVSIEKRYIRKDGTVKWVSAAWARKWDDDGIGYQEVSTMVDITELKEASENLKRKEGQFRFIFESAPIGLLWSYAECKPDGKGINFLERLVNPAHLKITGLSREDSDIPGIFDTISDPDDLKIQNAGIKKHLKNGDGIFSMEKRYTWPNGEIRWVSISWLRKWETFPKTYHEISTLVDITEQKKINAEVIKAKIAAEAANNAKSQFLSTMSHEIRTPMNGLIGVLHIMENNASPEIRELLRIAQNSADELLTLINDVLDFSKIEAGKVELENKTFPIDELIESTIESQINNAIEKGLELHCNIRPEAAIELNGDPHRLKQVLSNLLSNAIKFTAKGHVEVGAQIINGNDLIEIYVKDTGIGIKPDIQKKLFQAFTQANASTTREYGGTGLGLSICKSIIEKMNGRIGITSQEGLGSTFWIQIPTNKNDTIPFENTGIQKQRNALIIVKNLITTQYLKTWLNQWDCNCHLANNSSDALESINTLNPNTNYDLLIIDTTSFQRERKNWESLFDTNEKLKNTEITLLNRPSPNPDKTPSCFNNSIASPPKLHQIHAALIGQTIHSYSKNDTNETTADSKDLSKSQILLVDDNTINRTITSKLLLIKHKISADLACNGLEAIEALKAKKYDIVFMDCMMPEMDGYDATRAIRNGEAGIQNQNIPILALTANAMRGDQEKCLNAGMDDHITKPISPIKIKSQLLHWLGKEHRHSKMDVSNETESAKQSEANTQLFNPTILEEIFEGDEKTIANALTIFIETSIESLKSLKQAIDDKKDFERAVFIAHRIKGGSAEIGADALKSAAEKLENLNTKESKEQILAQHRKIEEVSIRTFEIINQRIQNAKV